MTFRKFECLSQDERLRELGVLEKKRHSRFYQCIQKPEGREAIFFSVVLSGRTTANGYKFKSSKFHLNTGKKPFYFTVKMIKN